MKKILYVIYEETSGKKGKNDDKKKLWVTFVGDSVKLKRHIINYTIKYYMDEKRKKTLKEKLVVKFKDVDDNDDKNIYKSNNYELQLFYDIDVNQKIKNERKRIGKEINNLIPFFGNQIKKYSNTTFIKEKNRRNSYKLCKKRLFSWRGFWSDRFLFYKHPEYLKYKIKNHLTKDMTKIILTPILDVEYYLPKFSKFDKNKLFNEGDYKYKINLDIDSIFDYEEDKKEIKEINENKIVNELDDLQFDRNYYGFNYLECIYKLAYRGLWKKYKNYYEQKLNFEKNSKSRSMSVSTNFDRFQSKTHSITINKDTNIYKCCLVKLTHHIKGVITTEDNRIKFTFCQDEGNTLTINDDDCNIILKDSDDDPMFDKDMGACFGSTFKNKKNDKDKVYLIITQENIKYLFIRNYFYQETGLEIYTTTHKNYYFNFKNNNQLHEVISEILKKGVYREIKTDDYKGKKILGYEKSINQIKKKNNYHVNDKMIEWNKYKISTLEYIMWMNIYGGRSYNDLTQYPVFPWLITDYTSDELNYDENTFRNLFLPIGMIENEKYEKSFTRKEGFIDKYESLLSILKESFQEFNYTEYLKKGDEYYDNFRNKKVKGNFFERTFSLNSKTAKGIKMEETDTNVNSIELNQLPSYYGSHYSNPTYVSHFLTRIFPFSLIAIEIQGDKFDNPDRMFLSISRTFESASTLNDDIRELIPEFYTLPDIFQNKNNLNLAQGKTDVNNDKTEINDVELPPWSNDVPSTFIAEKRKILERSDLEINKWIDIIFGSYQRGEKAAKINNIFQAQTYERMVKIDSIKDDDMRNALLRLVEVGVTPMQILDVDSKPRIDKKEFLLKNSTYSLSKGNTLDESTKLISVVIETKKIDFFNNKYYDNYKYTNNKEYQQIIEPNITKIICVNPKLLKIFINNNYYYNINLQYHDNKISIEESNFLKIENISLRYAPSYQMSKTKLPSIIFNNCKNIIKAGFWDERIETNKIPTTAKDESINKYKNYYITMGGPIVTMAMSQDEKYILFGTKLGYVACCILGESFKIRPQCKINDHSDEITSLSINDTLNMFASASMDGYIMIYILPTFVLVNSIQITQTIHETDISEGEFLYANNIFLSSSPLPCLVAFISSKKLFQIFSINGGYLGEVGESEDTKQINSPIVFKNLEFQDFLIYGTDDGYVKIRSFPYMKLINLIKPFEGKEIQLISLSPDKRYCFAWSYGNKIAIIKDETVTRVDVKDKDKQKDKDKDKDKDKNVDEQNEDDID